MNELKVFVSSVQQKLEKDMVKPSAEIRNRTILVYA